MSFTFIERSVVILRLSSGVLKQSKAYERNGYIYAAHGGGFISLNHIQGTSVSSVKWLEITAPLKLKYNEVGFVVNAETYKGDGKLKDLKHD